jgi:hypothetical protein
MSARLSRTSSEAQISYPEWFETARLAVSHVIAKATAIGDRANATDRALPSLFQSEVSVLPGPPTFAGSAGFGSAAI